MNFRFSLISCIIAILILMACRPQQTQTPTPMPETPSPTRSEPTDVPPSPDFSTAAAPTIQATTTPDRLPPTPYTGRLPDGAVAVLGMGKLSVSVSPDSQYFAVRSAVGVMAYDFNSLAPLWDEVKPPGDIAWLTEGRIQIGRSIWEIETGRLLWETSEVRQLSPDGSLVVGISGTTVTLYDRETGASRLVLSPPTDDFFAASASPDFRWRPKVSFSPDSHYAAVSYIGSIADEVAFIPLVKVWDVHSAVLLHSLTDIEPEFEDLTWSPDSTYLVATALNDEAIWDVQSGQLLLLQTDLGFPSWSPDSTRFATTGDGQLRVWDARTMQPVYSRPLAHLSPVAWSSDGTELVAATYYENAITVFDALRGDSLARIENARCTTPCAFSANQNYLIGSLGQQNTSAVWDVSQPARGPVFTLVGSYRVTDLAWSPDGLHLASGESGYDLHIPIWNVAAAQLETLIDVDSLSPENANTMFSVAWSPDDRWIAFTSTGPDGVWNLEQQSSRWQPFGDSIAFSPDGSRLATIPYGTLAIYESIGPDKPVMEVALPAEMQFTDLDWSDDGRYIAVAARPVSDMGSEVLIIDMETGNITAHLRDVSGFIDSIAWSPDGKRIAAGFAQDKVAIWDVETQDVLTQLSGKVIPRNEDESLSYLSIDWSSDGSLLAAAYGYNGSQGDCAACGGGNSGAVVVWRVDQGYSLMHTFIDEDYESAAVAFSPDSSLLAAGSRSGVITLWNMDN